MKKKLSGITTQHEHETYLTRHKTQQQENIGKKGEHRYFKRKIFAKE